VTFERRKEEEEDFYSPEEDDDAKKKAITKRMDGANFKTGAGVETCNNIFWDSI
jgi:hypothetical protein